MSTDEQNIRIFDSKLLRTIKKRASQKKTDSRFLHEWSARELGTRLSEIKRTFPRALLYGAPEFKEGNSQIETSIHMDCFARQDHSTVNLIGEQELLAFKDKSLDLFISNLSLHHINDLPGTLIQIRRALKPDGLFIGAMFGGETLHELRESLMQAELEQTEGASPRIFPFADKQQTGALLQRAGFALPVVDSEILQVTYSDIFALMHDLRNMGEQNVILSRRKTNPGKAFFMEAGRYYADNFSEKDGRIVASFEIIFLIGWAPHESQQIPLKPGSAKNRLAEALDTKEIKTGEKAIP